MLKKYGLKPASVPPVFGYRTVLSQVLLSSWVPEAKPMVTATLDDGDSEVVDSAAQVLERHSTIADFPRVLAAVERLANVKYRPLLSVANAFCTELDGAR